MIETIRRPIVEKRKLSLRREILSGLWPLPSRPDGDHGHSGDARACIADGLSHPLADTHMREL